MVDAVRYAPLGKRGAAGGSRAARFGTVPWQEHTRQSNEEVLLSVMTEDAKGIDDIEKIAALDGVRPCCYRADGLLRVHGHPRPQ